MKKLLTTITSIISISVLASNVVSCFNWQDAEKYFYDDRTELQKQSQKAIDNDILSKNLELNGKKVILLGLDGVSYKSAPEVYDGIYDFRNHKGIGEKYSNVYDTGVFPIQSFASGTGWHALLFSNLFANQRDKDTQSVFDVVQKAKTPGIVDSVTNDFMEGYVIGGSGIQLNGTSKWGDFESTVCEPTTSPVSATKKVMGTLDLIAQVFLNRDDATFEDLKNANGKFTPANNWTLFDFYNEVLDVCGHAHFWYDSEVISAINKAYNEMFKFFFDKSIFNPDKYLVLSLTDHGRDEKGWDHNYGDDGSHESYIIANQSLPKLLGRDSDYDENETVNKEFPFKFFYDVKELTYKYLTSKKEG
jgi:hypothetical protein